MSESSLIPSFSVLCGDALTQLRTLPSESIHCCITSPPFYALRDYGVSGQIGLEATPDAYVTKLIEVFREVRRVLKTNGTLWLNLGDSYVSAPTGSLSTKPSLMTGGRKTQEEGTTGIVALKHGRSYIGIELNADYVKLSHERYESSREQPKARLDIFY